MTGWHDAVTGNYSDRTEFNRLQAAALGDVFALQTDAFRSRHTSP